MLGNRYNRLLVVSEDEPAVYPYGKRRRYVCKCDCGNTITAFQSNLSKGATQSCGCWKKDTAGQCRITHNMSATAEYKVWAGIKKRCYNSNHKEFHLWGGKGVTMCDSWRDDFSAFYRDMGQRPSAKHSIDRIDGSGKYSPENCRWATQLEQSRNTKKTRKFEWRGESLTLKEIAASWGASYNTLYDWVVRRGLSIEQAYLRASGN